MLDKIWAWWKETRTNEPVKARFVKLLFVAGVAVVPFMTVWAYSGFATAMGMIAVLVISGLALLLLGVLVNYVCGGFARWGFTGQFPDVDDWFDNTVLDEWEHYQHAKAHAPKPHAVDVTAAYCPPTNMTVKIEPHRVDIAPNPDDDGPDWLKKT